MASERIVARGRLCDDWTVVARTPSTLPLVVADGLALFAFVLIGTDHHMSGTAANVARTASPLLAAWFVVAALVGAYRRPGPRSLALTWVVAVPAGAVLRSLVRGGPWDDRLLVFTGVALAFTALFLLAARGVVASIRWTRKARSAEGAS